MSNRKRLRTRLAAGAAVLLCAALAPASADSRLAPCFECHGGDGRAPVPGAPWLGGQPAFYVLTQLSLFREEQRRSPAMIAIARGLSDEEMIELADAVAALPPPSLPFAPPDARRFERGRAVVRRQRCGACHGADFGGGEQVPRLANQREDYLLKSLQDFKRGARVGYGPAMVDVMAEVDPADLPAIAHYLARLPRSSRND